MPLIFLWIALILVCALYSALPTLSPGMWVSEWVSEWVSAGVRKQTGPQRVHSTTHMYTMSSYFLSVSLSSYAGCDWSILRGPLNFN